jgi:diguanylate cyclase (GGDEF)-like protein
MSDEELKKRISQLEEELAQARSGQEAIGNLLEKKLNEIYTHYHVSRIIGSLPDLQEMLRQVTGTIRKALHFDRASVYLLNDNSDQMELVFYSGLNVQDKVLIRVGEGTPGRIVESGEHVHLHDLSAFYESFNDFVHFPKEERKTGSYIGVALKVHNTTIGIIGIDSAEKYSLSVDDMDFMAILSYQIAAGIEKSRLFDRIQQLSQRDGLTGLFNHRVFEERLSQELSRRDRTQKPLSLIILDIDHFKQFNDSFGHQAGDKVLKQLAQIVMKQCRCASIDICCRYGGEEFALIMPELELHNAVKAAERLRKVVESTTFDVNHEHLAGKVTISLGVAGISGSEDISPEVLVKKADDALYLSKRNGRNQVSYSPGEMP